LIWGKRLSDKEPFFAAGAGFEVAAGELVEEILPGLGVDVFFSMAFHFRLL
jgi:hypothetical protein